MWTTFLRSSNGTVSLFSADHQKKLFNLDDVVASLTLVNLMALLSKLVKICLHRVESPFTSLGTVPVSKRTDEDDKT
jgi:hypothetical protein